jgi:hypothetical protein
MMDNIILFSGKNNKYGEFSNFHIAPFTLGDDVFNSAEHYFMFYKARFFDPDGEAIKQMGNDKTPAQMKKLGRQVKNFDGERWVREGCQAMYEAVYAKFSKNPELKQKLLDTGYTIIAEASHWDKKWGTGYSASSPHAYNFEKWGKNWLGLILMGVRAELRYGRVNFGAAPYPVEPTYDQYRHGTSVKYNLLNCHWPSFVESYLEYPEGRDICFSYSAAAQMTGYVQIEDDE